MSVEDVVREMVKNPLTDGLTLSKTVLFGRSPKQYRFSCSARCGTGEPPRLEGLGSRRLLELVGFLQYHILHLHQAGDIAALIFIQLHGDIPYLLLEARNHHVLQRVDAAQGLFNVSEGNAMRIYGLVQDSIVDGPGFRFSCFVQGCPHHCPGCHNPDSHDIPYLLLEARNHHVLQRVDAAPGLFNVSSQ